MAWLWSKRKPAFTVMRLLTVIASLMKPAAVTNMPPVLDGSTEIFRRQAVVVHVADARRNDHGRDVLAAFDLCADLRLMIRADERGAEVAEVVFTVLWISVESLNWGGAPLRRLPGWSVRLMLFRSPVLGRPSCSETKRLTRMSQTVLAAMVCKVTECGRRNRGARGRVASNGRVKVGCSGFSQNSS